jgi:hypothetical protein
MFSLKRKEFVPENYVSGTKEDITYNPQTGEFKCETPCGTRDVTNYSTIVVEENNGQHIPTIRCTNPNAGHPGVAQGDVSKFPICPNMDPERANKTYVARAKLSFLLGIPR